MNFFIHYISEKLKSRRFELNNNIKGATLQKMYVHTILNILKKSLISIKFSKCFVKIPYAHMSKRRVRRNTSNHSNPYLLKQIFILLSKYCFRPYIYVGYELFAKSRRYPYLYSKY